MAARVPDMFSKFYTVKNQKMVQNAKNVNIGWNTNISFYLEMSGGQNYNLYLNVVYLFNNSVKYTYVAD